MCTSSVSRLCFVLIACLVISGSAFAHAILVDSNPPVNATISGTGLVISLKFNVRIDTSRSHLEILLPDGKKRSLPVKAGSAPNMLSTPVTDLKPGRYRLIWQVLASDGHITRGEIRFSAT